MKTKSAYAYAWKIQDSKGNWQLCYWSEPTRARLESRGKPTPEAKSVRVKMTPG